MVFKTIQLGLKIYVASIDIFGYIFLELTNFIDKVVKHTLRQLDSICLHLACWKSVTHFYCVCIYLDMNSYLFHVYYFLWFSSLSKRELCRSCLPLQLHCCQVSCYWCGLVRGLLLCLRLLWSKNWSGESDFWSQCYFYLQSLCVLFNSYGLFQIMLYSACMIKGKKVFPCWKNIEIRK